MLLHIDNDTIASVKSVNLTPLQHARRNSPFTSFDLYNAVQYS